MVKWCMVAVITECRVGEVILNGTTAVWFSMPLAILVGCSIDRWVGCPRVQLRWFRSFYNILWGFSSRSRWFCREIPPCNDLWIWAPCHLCALHSPLSHTCFWWWLPCLFRTFLLGFNVDVLRLRCPWGVWNWLFLNIENVVLQTFIWLYMPCVRSFSYFFLLFHVSRLYYIFFSLMFYFFIFIHCFL